jgi:hypothetical protein
MAKNKPCRVIQGEIVDAVYEIAFVNWHQTPLSNVVSNFPFAVRSTEFVFEASPVPGA